MLSAGFQFQMEVAIRMMPPATNAPPNTTPMDRGAVRSADAMSSQSAENAWSKQLFSLRSTRRLSPDIWMLPRLRQVNKINHLSRKLVKNPAEKSARLIGA